LLTTVPDRAYVIVTGKGPEHSTAALRYSFALLMILQGNKDKFQSSKVYNFFTVLISHTQASQGSTELSNSQRIVSKGRQRSHNFLQSAMASDHFLRMVVCLSLASQERERITTAT
jgi:hypothetical protein